MSPVRKGASTRAVARKANRQMVLRALTDPKFRKLLSTQPHKALGKTSLTAIQKKEVELVLAAIKGIESQMAVIADELLCACSVAV